MDELASTARRVAAVWGGRAASARLATLALAGAAAVLTSGCEEETEWRVAAHPEAIPPAVCIGGDVPKTAWITEPSGEALPDAGAAQPEGPAVGTPTPQWALYDFQPQSCGYQGVYGLDAFRGRVTVVSFWSGSCGFCWEQAGACERMRIELEVEGHPAFFVGVSVPQGAEYRDHLVERCAFPLFQDLDEVGAMSLHQAHVDDILVYDSEGRLAAYLPMDGEQSINLSTPEAYENLKRIILETE